MAIKVKKKKTIYIQKNKNINTYKHILTVWPYQWRDNTQ